MSIRRYVSSVVLLFVASLAALVYIERPIQQSHLEATLCFAVLAILSHVLVYKTSKGAAGSVAFIPFLAACVLSPNWVTVIAMVSSCALAELRTPKPLIKSVFNVAQVGTALACAILTFLSLGGTSPLDGAGLNTTETLAYFLGFAVFTGLNKILVSGAISLSEHSSLTSMLRSIAFANFANDLLSLPFAYAFAALFAHFGPISSLVLAVPLLVVRQLYRTNWQLERTNHELLQLMVKAIEARDPYTSGHSRRVSEYAAIISRAVNMRQRQVDRIATAALLHDVGKIYEDFAPILRKPSSLSAEERVTIESHSERGAQLVATVSQLEDLVPVIRHHHERWDGAGYPAKIAGESIPIGARVIMLADTIDAMTSDRPYRAALGKDAVILELRRVSGRQFDPILVEGFLTSPLHELLFDAVSRYQRLVVPDREASRKSGSGALRIA